MFNPNSSKYRLDPVIAERFRELASIDTPSEQEARRIILALANSLVADVNNRDIVIPSDTMDECLPAICKCAQAITSMDPCTESEVSIYNRFCKNYTVHSCSVSAFAIRILEISIFVSMRPADFEHAPSV